MSNLTSFIDVDVKNEDSMREFLDLNAISHETIYNTLMTQSQIVIEHYPLWTMGGADQNWLFIHDREHKAISNALNLSLPPDLDEVDFNDKDAAADWFFQHDQLHQLISQALNL